MKPTRHSFSDAWLEPKAGDENTTWTHCNTSVHHGYFQETKFKFIFSLLNDQRSQIKCLVSINLILHLVTWYHWNIVAKTRCILPLPGYTDRERLHFNHKLRPSNILLNKSGRSSSFWQKKPRKMFLLGKQYYSEMFICRWHRTSQFFPVSTSPNSTK